MTDGYAYIMPMRGYVNLRFYQGAMLAEANRPAVRALLAKALARRRGDAKHL